MESAKSSTENGRRLRFFLGLAIVFAGLVLWDWRFGEEGTNPPVAARHQRDDTAPTGTAVELVPGRNGEDQAAHALANLELDTLHDTIGRPLFEKRRRPVEPPVAHVPVIQAPAAPPRRLPDPNALTLLGILLSEGRTIALLKRNPSGQNVRVEEGDTIDGWTIERIESQRIVLRQDGTQIALQLFRKR